jgi:thiamine-monophosphate kinase
LEVPEPRVALGEWLRGVASSAIDVSDGLLGDLGHVLRRSAVGARLDVDALPRSAQLAALPAAVQQECLLHGGDDYELLFTAAPARHQAVLAAAREAGVPVSCIGRIEPGDGLVVTDGRGQTLVVERGGFDHFRT